MTDKDAMEFAQTRNAEQEEEEKGLIAAKSESDQTTASQRALAEKQKLGVFDTSLALVAATVGGEIVAIPFAV